MAKHNCTEKSKQSGYLSIYASTKKQSIISLTKGFFST